MLKLFRSEPMIRIVATLALHPEGELGASELMAATGSGYTNVTYLLRSLEDDGLVAHRSVGKKALYRLVEQHPLYPELASIAIKTFGGQELILRAIRDDEHVQFAAIFGSFAKGSATPMSDIDVLVIIDEDDADETDYRLASALSMVGDRLGRPVHANIVRRGAVASNEIVQEILAGPLVVLKGDAEHA